MSLQVSNLETSEGAVVIELTVFDEIEAHILYQISEKLEL